VSSTELAVVLRGFDAVRRAVLAVSVFNTFSGAERERKTQHFSIEEFWKHSVAVACCSELLADELIATYGRDAGIDGCEALVCGLLHDLGKVALDAGLPKSYDKVVDGTEVLR